MVIRFCWPPFRTRKRIDSGRTAIDRIASRIGIEPPTRNTACHPNRLMTAAATQPAHADPNENPQNIVMTAAFLERSGMYSEVSAMALGIAPPIPIPVNTRNAVSCATETAVAVSSDPIANVIVHAISTGLRPTRSASGPNVSAPIIMPKVPLEITVPNVTRGMWSSALSAGATKPITCASNPSMNTIAAHRPATRN